MNKRLTRFALALAMLLFVSAAASVHAGAIPGMMTSNRQNMGMSTVKPQPKPQAQPQPQPAAPVQPAKKEPVNAKLAYSMHQKRKDGAHVAFVTVTLEGGKPQSLMLRQGETRMGLTPVKISEEVIELRDAEYDDESDLVKVPMKSEKVVRVLEE